MPSPLHSDPHKRSAIMIAIHSRWWMAEYCFSNESGKAQWKKRLPNNPPHPVRHASVDNMPSGSDHTEVYRIDTPLYWERNSRHHMISFLNSLDMLAWWWLRFSERNRSSMLVRNTLLCLKHLATKESFPTSDFSWRFVAFFLELQSFNSSVISQRRSFVTAIVISLVLNSTPKQVTIVDGWHAFCLDSLTPNSSKRVCKKWNAEYAFASSSTPWKSSK